MKGRNILRWFLPAAAMLLAYGCLDRYNPPTSKADVHYLVIEGILNSGGELTTISLSRTSPVGENNQGTSETNASVQIEGDDGSIYTLSETNPGTYTLAAQVLDATLHFRLHSAKTSWA